MVSARNSAASHTCFCVVCPPRFDQAWVGGFSNLMDEFRTFMGGRPAPFRLNGLRAIFVTTEDDLDEEKVRVCMCGFLFSNNRGHQLANDSTSVQRERNVKGIRVKTPQ